MIISFCAMLIASAVYNTFFGLPTTQWTSKGHKVFPETVYLKMIWLLLKLIHAFFWFEVTYVDVPYSLLAKSDPIDLNGKRRNI